MEEFEQENAAYELRMARLEAFSKTLADKRTEAINHRIASGIETIWAEDEDHYNGGEDQGSQWGKGRTADDGLQRKPSKEAFGSTVFLKITRPYVDAAAARISDMLGRDAWDIKPEPVPDMVVVGQPPDAAAKSCELAKKQIQDWRTECNYTTHERRCIESAMKLGTGILKGPVPVIRRKRVMLKEQDGSWQIKMQANLQPEWKAVNPWNFYPDPACGEDIQNGGFTFECEDITARALVELIKAQEDQEEQEEENPDQKTPRSKYIKEAVIECIKEGPIDAVTGTRANKKDQETKEKDVFQIWYAYGSFTREDLEAAGCPCKDDLTSIDAMVTMVNGRIIKAAYNPLQSGEFPYSVMRLQVVPDAWYGTGIARQMRECQKGANAAVRALQDNMALSAGPMLVIDRSKIIPANKKWEITPRKIWYTHPDEENVDVRQAVQIIVIPTLQGELMNVLQMWLTRAEDVTGLPMLLQGQQGKAPDTVGGMEIINQNGSTVLRRIARNHDDDVTIPGVGRDYEWLMLYGPNETKGQYTVEAMGSNVLVEREIQKQAMLQMLGASLNPAYGLDPALVMQDVLLAMKLQPDKLTISQEKRQMAASQPPPEDPRVTAAKIMAGQRAQATQAAQQTAQAEIKLREDAIVAGVQEAKMKLDHDAKQRGMDRELKEVLAGVQARLDSAQTSADERQHLELMKVKLTDTSIKLKAQENMMLRTQTIKPAVEPIGQAADGMAFVE